MRFTQRTRRFTLRDIMSSSQIRTLVHLGTLMLFLCTFETADGRLQALHTEHPIREEMAALDMQELGLNGDLLPIGGQIKKESHQSDHIVSQEGTNRWSITDLSKSEESTSRNHGVGPLDNSSAISEAISQSLRISATSECEPSYGVLPCSNNIVGNLFLLIVYGYLLLKAATMLSDGSELLLTVLDAGLIGGLLLPVLGALPDSLLILVSGLGGTQAEAQEQVLVGIGLLAGSIVMLLTVLWGTCLILGRCDLLESQPGQLVAKDKQLTKGFSLTGTGVTIDDLTKVSSLIMMVTVTPYIVAQLPRIFGFSAEGNIPVLVACIISLAGLLGYCLYQVFWPWIQKRRILYAKSKVHKYAVMGRMHQLSQGLGNLFLVSGKLNHDVVNKLFDAFDTDKDGYLSEKETRYLLNVSLLHSSKKPMAEEATEYFIKEFDETKDNLISRDEFLTGMQKWFTSEHQRADILENIRNDAENIYDQFLENEEDFEDDEQAEENPPTKDQIIRKSILLLLGGTIIAAVFADPLVDAVNDFSKVTKIPSFFISFVLLPLASNSSESVSSIVFASRKRKKNMSLTFSQIYGGVTMNNTMGLGIFLAVVYGRQLVWDFSSEVLVIILVTVISSLMAGFRKTLPLWMAGIGLSLYPISLGLVAILDYVAGWQ